MSSPDRSDAVYNSQLDGFTRYHQVQESPSSLSIGPALPALGHAVAGSVATSVSKLLIYPLDLVITRLQVQNTLHGPRETPSAAKDAAAEYSGLVDAVRKIYANEGGISAFYTGCAPDVAKGFADSFLFFLAYTFLRKREQMRHGQVSVPRELGVGIAAGTFAKLITTPLQNVITRQQTAALVSARSPETADLKDLSVRTIARQIYAERGLQGFWSGYSASIILTLNPSLTFAVDNLLHRVLLRKAARENPAAWTTFLIAAMSKVVATTVTYPVSLAKSRAQVSASAPGKGTEKLGTSKSRSERRAWSLLSLLTAQRAIFISLRRIHHEEGLSGLYAGLDAEVVKGFLSHGLTMAMKDRIHVSVVQVYYVLLKLLKQWPEELQELKGKAVEAVETVKDSATHVVGDLKTRAPDVSQIREKAGEIVESAKDSAGSAVEGIQARTDNATQIQEQAGNVVESVKSGVGSVVGAVTSNTSNATGVVGRGVDAVNAQVKGAATEIGAAIGEKVKAATE